MLQTHAYPTVQASRWEVVGIVLENGDRPTEDSLEEEGVDAQGFIALFRNLMLNQPFQRFGNKFKPLRHVQNVFQVSTVSERILGFRCRHQLILTTPFRKKSNQTDATYIEECKRIATRFFDQHGS